MQFVKRFLPGFSSETKAVRPTRRLYGAAGLGFFLFGLLGGFYLSFPDAVLRQRLVHELEARLPIRVELADTGLRPLMTLTGEKGIIRSLDRSETIVSIDRFSFSPLWTGLFKGDPGIKGKFLTADGELAVSWQRSGPLTMAATSLPVNIPLTDSPVVRLAGILTTRQVLAAAPLQKDSRSLIELTLEQGALQGLEALTGNAAGLRLGKVSLRMTGQGTSFTIEQLEASGGDVIVSGKGTLMLAMANPKNSRINLMLSVRAGSQEDPTLANFLEFAGTPLPGGNRQLILSGTLANPVLR
jgi:type II secretion system protein N